MGRYLILLFMFSFSIHASDKLHLELISGHWVCSFSYEEEGLTVKETAKYTYDISNFTYSYSARKKTYHQNKTLFGILQVIDEGHFTYESSKMIYDTKSVNIESLYDPFEVFSEKLIKEMEDELRDDKTPIQTTFINEIEWETKYPNDNFTTLCTRDITK